MKGACHEGPHGDPRARAGTLGDVGEATGRAGINIEGVSGTNEAGQGVIRVLVEDAAAARSALGDAGFEVRGERDVLVVDVEDRPGTMGEVARRIGNVGVNIELAHTTFDAVRPVLGVDDVDNRAPRSRFM